MAKHPKRGDGRVGAGIAFPPKKRLKRKTCLSDGEEVYRDLLAATGPRFRRVTPEETVRQKFVEFLRRDVGVPGAMLKTEDAVSHYVRGARGRADIVGFGPSAPNKGKRTPDAQAVPLFVVECKRPGCPLDYGVKRQALGYAGHIKTRFVILTDGEELRAYRIQRPGGSPEELAAMPSYEDMLGNRVRHAPVRAWSRPPHARLAAMSRKEIESDERLAGCLGTLTPDGVARLTVELASLLLDDHTEPDRWSAEDGGCSMHPVGLRHVTPRNPSGGSWTGMHRHWEVRRPEGNRFVGLALLSAWNGKSTMLITTDQGRSAAVLELAMDDFLELRGNQARLYHHGRMRGGVKGATMEAMLEWIAEHAPHLLRAGVRPRRRRQVDLGALPLDCRLEWSHVGDLVMRCAEYGLAREAFMAHLTAPK